MGRSCAGWRRRAFRRGGTGGVRTGPGHTDPPGLRTRAPEVVVPGDPVRLPVGLTLRVVQTSGGSSSGISRTLLPRIAIPSNVNESQFFVNCGVRGELPTPFVRGGRGKRRMGGKAGARGEVGGEGLPAGRDVRPARGGAFGRVFIVRVLGAARVWHQGRHGTGRASRGGRGRR